MSQRKSKKGGSKSQTLDSDERIEDVKRKFEQKEGIPTDQQRLIFGSMADKSRLDQDIDDLFKGAKKTVLKLRSVRESALGDPSLSYPMKDAAAERIKRKIDDNSRVMGEEQSEQMIKATLGALDNALDQVEKQGSEFNNLKTELRTWRSEVFPISLMEEFQPSISGFGLTPEVFSALKTAGSEAYKLYKIFSDYGFDRTPPPPPRPSDEPHSEDTFDKNGKKLSSGEPDKGKGKRGGINNLNDKPLDKLGGELISLLSEPKPGKHAPSMEHWDDAYNHRVLRQEILALRLSHDKMATDFSNSARINKVERQIEIERGLKNVPSKVKQSTLLPVRSGVVNTGLTAS